MAGTATNYNANKIVIGPAQLWADVAVPGAAARMTLATDGTPDATANPNAKHLGLTEGGWEVDMKATVQDFFSDEFAYPHLSRIDSEPQSIKGSILQISDEDLVLKYLSPNGTYGTAAGYKEMTFGGKVIPVYYSFALIWPTIADPTKFHVLQFYKANNVAGYGFKVDRKNQSAAGIEIRAYGIPSRAVNDQLSNLWVQI